MNRLRHVRFAMLGAALGAAAAVPAAAAPARIVIGQGEAWVRAFFPPSGEADISRIRWTNCPPEIDFDSLQVWNVRRPWPLSTWRWVQPAVPAAPTGSAPVVWRPGTDSPPPPARDQLEIELAVPMSHRMGHSLVYRLPGPAWTVFYRILVRGIGPTAIQSVQIDLTAYLRIRNPTSADFPDAQVSLLGPDAVDPAPVKPFGLLDLNTETSLTDLWLVPPPPQPALSHYYPLATPAQIPAQGQAEIQFARIKRKPAEIVHVCDSDDIPAPTVQGGLPLQRVLVIANTPAMGLGFPLPPGEADLFLGAVRGAPSQSGRVESTPFPGALRVAMGSVPAVRASRNAAPDVPLPEGAWQSDRSITLVNALESPVQIQVLEAPDTPMEWDLVRSSIPGTVTTRALRFELTLPPDSTQTITYRLRLTAKPI